MSRKRIPDIDSSWFHRVFGFHEIIGDYNINQYRLQQMQLLRHDKTILQRSSDGMLLHCGSFELPSLYEMRQQCQQLLIQIQQLQQQQLGSNNMSTGITNVTTTSSVDQSSSVPVSIFGPIHAINIQSDAYELHANPIAANGIIQAASQFNCLEFPSPNVLPEHGINMYWRDHTQGPACAIACGAGTAFRNYLITFDQNNTTTMRKTADSDNNKNDNDRGSEATTCSSTKTTTTTTTTIGQRQHSQINTLDTLLQTLQLLHSDQNQLQPIHVKNGYAKTRSDTELEQWNPLILQHIDELRNVLKVGIQRHTQVTSILPEQVFVTQVYCSAIPVAYSTTSSQIWEPMARLILEGCYELTLLVGVRAALEKAIAAAAIADVSKTKSDLPLLTPTRVFLTLVGGGVFGNKLEWIWSAIDRAFHIISDEYGVALEVYFVHYRSTSFEAEAFVHNWNQAKQLL